VTWTPRAGTQGVFERGVVNNTMTILTRDMKPALDHFFAADNYPDFAERNVGQIVKLEFPCLAIGPRDNSVEDSEDMSHVVESPSVDIYIGVQGSSAANVTNKIMSYVQVADSVLRNAKNDFFTGMSNPFGLWLEIVHDYGPIGEKDLTYFRGAMLRLTVHLNER
jgi:hypothetical protein